MDEDEEDLEYLLEFQYGSGNNWMPLPEPYKESDELIRKREDIKTFDELVAFLEYVKNNCNSGYGISPIGIRV